MKKPETYKWYILSLVVFTNMTVAAIPMMGIAVLAKEISVELSLTLVQIGVVWGIGALPGIFTGMIAGAIGDKFGPKVILASASLLAGLLGAARGLASDFFSMTVIVILLGALIPFVTMNGLKTCGMWFPSRQLGLANGLISMGMAVGFLIGSLASATVLSPLLGSWRYVLILYGVLGAAMSIPWFFSRPAPPGYERHGQSSIWKNITHIVRFKNIWLLGLTLFGVGGCVQGLLGYLPLYLRTIGWYGPSADSSVAIFHALSMAFVLPIALWSDRLRSRKALLSIATFMIFSGVFLLSITGGKLVWVAVSMAGMARDAFMAIFFTMVIETEGVGPAYAGTAAGFAMAVGGIGNSLAPPLGNSLGIFTASAPFACWTAFAAFGIICLLLIRKTSRRINLWH